MKTSEKLCAKMNIASCLEDEKREYDAEVDDYTKESIRIHNKTIEIATQILLELDS